MVANDAFLQQIMNSQSWVAWSNNIPVLGLAALFIVVLVHMAGISFNIPSLRAWARGEYMQVIVTFLLVWALVLLMNLAWNTMVDVASEMYLAYPAFAAGHSAGARFDPFVFAQVFLKETMIDCEIIIYRVAYAINFFYKFIGALKTETLGVEMVGGWYSTVYSSFLEYLAGHINFLLLLHWLQINFLSLIKYVGPVLIQLGLVLRILPFTRGAGGMLLAMGFGFFAVYPITIAMLMTLQPPGSSFCTTFAPPALLDVERYEGGFDSADMIIASASVQGSSGEISEFIEKAKNFLPLFYMQALFLPMVSLIITFTFIRQTGALFGADLNEVGRGLIKLI
ncbi:hypothetical protein COU37_02035 [Candidatus Micrarchaeota archaeon CG10_big_fil_rev_8_21_14_0_10_45_29]|nr:MAG: hypothetical protein COU37_02035 [Candidatus Micrarchaeota archaeon CG10_big_fil_rev_8_21_14_0_10_45_29]